MKTNLVGTTIAVLIIGAGSFVGGMKYQESKSSARTENVRQFQNSGSQQGGGIRSGNGRLVMGEILSTDTTSVTVKLQDGSSKIILLTDKTTINKTSQGAKDELKTGIRVAASGTDNSDGSVTAASIQLDPAFGFMRGNSIQTP